MKVLVIGGSRNIGYLASQRLLASGATVTFLLRNKSCFDADESLKPYIASGKARLVQGDALKEDDMKNAWNAAAEGADGPLDAVLFTVGGTLEFGLTKGLTLTPPDLCTRSLLNLLSIYPRDAVSQPKLVVISTNGLGKTAHSALPLVLKPIYRYALAAPSADKLGMERALVYAAGWQWPSADGEPDKEILSDGWKDRVGPEGWLKHLVIVRPAVLTNGESMGDAPNAGSEPYRASDKDMTGSYTISRKDIAHFIVAQVLPDWQKWEGKCVRVAY